MSQIRAGAHQGQVVCWTLAATRKAQAQHGVFMLTPGLYYSVRGKGKWPYKEWIADMC